MTFGAGYFGGAYFGGDPVGGLGTWTAIGKHLPDLSVEIDFATDPTTAIRAWTDVTTDVRALSYSRAGRSDVLQQTSTGTLSMTLDNRSGDYDPLNADSAHFPGVKRLRWMRVRARWNGIIYPRWQGVITTITPSWPQGRDSIVDIQAADALTVLSLFDLGGLNLTAALAGQRVSDVCDAAGLVSVVEPGNSALVETGTISTGSSALSHLQAVEETENGRIFADESGRIVFQDRHHRWPPASQGTIGDHPAEIPYRDVALTQDDSNVWNAAAVTTAAGAGSAVEVTATNPASQASYFTRALTRSLLTADAVEAQAAAEYLVGLYGDPPPKLPLVTLLPVRGTAEWPTVLSAANGQQFTFRRRPSAYGGTIAIDTFVEQVSDVITPGEAWDIGLQLTPGDGQQFWVLDDPTYSLLGVSTFVSY